MFWSKAQKRHNAAVFLFVAPYGSFLFVYYAFLIHPPPPLSIGVKVDNALFYLFTMHYFNNTFSKER